MSAWFTVKTFALKNERYISPVTLVLGFIFDSIMLRRIDVFFSNALLISYLIISSLSILLLNIAVHRKPDEKETTLHLILVFIMQFCFGGLFSAAFLFYSKSGSLISSWPFLLLLLGYMIGNEFFRKNYLRLGFQVSAFFSALFAYLIFFLPIIFGQMSDAIFLLSGVFSLFITGFFVYVLSWFTAARVLKSLPIIISSIAGIFTLINILYFTNLIPPIPLALREVGIYHTVTSIDEGVYVLTGENHSWFEKFISRYDVHVDSGSSLYAWSSIFAPTNLSVDIVHVWQYFDTNVGEWVTASRISLYIIGGRENGFRTFSVKGNVFPGRWRVNVETLRGQLIGRITFAVVPSVGGEQLESTVK